MTILIGFTGHKGHGKNTVAALLTEHLVDRGMSPLVIQEYAFADPIKEGVQAMFGLTDAEVRGSEKEKTLERLGPEFAKLTSRKLQQTLGTEWG